MESKIVVSLEVVSYNMHGYFQGCPALDEFTPTEQPDVILLQEHCLTPGRL